MKSIYLSILLPLCGQASAQVYNFNSLSGVDSSTDGSLDGYTVADHYGGNDYSGYLGEMSLIFTSANDIPPGVGSPRGTFFGDAGGTYSGELGLVVFCLDSETGFLNSSSPAESFQYEAHSLASAEIRYLAEGVSGYRTGGLRRAAYLMDRYFDAAHAGGDLEAAAMQAAIWEVLTDEVPNVANGEGNYHVRTDSGSSLLNQRAQDIITLTNLWFTEAEQDDWGGTTFNPDDSVVFWLDPADTGLNQTVISLNPVGLDVTMVPEPGTLVLALCGALGLLRRRRVVHGDGIEPPTNRV